MNRAIRPYRSSRQPISGQFRKRVSPSLLTGSIGDGSFLFGELSLGLIHQARIESAVRMDQDFFAGFNGQAGLVNYFMQDDWHSSMNLGASEAGIRFRLSRSRASQESGVILDNLPPFQGGPRKRCELSVLWRVPNAQGQKCDACQGD